MSETCDNSFRHLSFPSAVKRLTTHPDRDDYPTWQPDGRHVVYVSERDGKHDLFVLEVGD